MNDQHPPAANTLERRVQLDTIRKLDELINAHLRWMNRFNQTLICGTAADASVTDDDAHRQCYFGRWYYGLDLSRYRPWLPQLKQIGAAHEQMHALAGRLSQGPRAPAIDTGDYDRFTESAYRFKTSVRALQFKLIRDVCLVDHLTGVWNRSSLFQRLTEEYDRMLRHGGPCCLCMMDLDHFKEVNDRHGHASGDDVLQEVARIAKQRLRRYDSIFRYGGEEFLLCLPKISAREAVTAMERIRSDIAATPIPLADGQAVAITASFGVAEFSTALTIEENIEVADRALFGAKAAGRNQVCRWNGGDGDGE